MLNLEDMIMLRLTQTEDFKTINSSCSTKEQVQKVSENFMKRIIALCDAEDDAISLFRILRYTSFSFTNFASGVSDERRGEKMYRSCSLSLTRSWNY